MSELAHPPKALLTTLALALSLSAPACEESTGGADEGMSGDDDDDRPTGPEVMMNTIDNTVVPDLVAFAASTGAMQAEVDTFCTSPSADTLQAVQDEWRSLSESWHAVAAYNLGPLDDDFIVPKIILIESMRQRGDDYTQTVRDAAVTAIEGEDPIDAAYIEGLTFNKVGLLALEVLVFEDSREGNSVDPADVLGDYEERPRKCEYLRGVNERLVATSAEVERGWTESFQEGDAFRDTMLGTELPDGSEPVAGLLIALQEHLAYVKDRKLEGIVDARLSGHFYPNVTAMLDALERLLEQPDPEDAAGILDFMDAHGFVVEAETVRVNLEAAKTAAANEDREGLAVAIGLLDGNIKREVPDALGVQLGLNFTDGD